MQKRSDPRPTVVHTASSDPIHASGWYGKTRGLKLPWRSARKTFQARPPQSGIPHSVFHIGPVRIQSNVVISPGRSAQFRQAAVPREIIMFHGGSLFFFGWRIQRSPRSFRDRGKCCVLIRPYCESRISASQKQIKMRWRGQWNIDRAFWESFVIRGHRRHRPIDPGVQIRIGGARARPEKAAASSIRITFRNRSKELKCGVRIGKIHRSGEARRSLTVHAAHTGQSPGIDPPATHIWGDILTKPPKADRSGGGGGRIERGGRRNHAPGRRTEVPSRRLTRSRYGFH